MSLRRTLDAMGAMVERASSVPLSASCMVNRAEMLALVERARAELPVELDQAAELLVAHQEVISRAEAEAEEMLVQAQADAEQMIADSALVASAQARSELILDAARAEAARLLRECDQYCDSRLAAFEDDLDRAVGQVRRGRSRLRERSALDTLEPLPEGADPEGYDVQVEYEEAGERQAERAAWVAAQAAYEQRSDTEDAYDQEREDAAGAVPVEASVHVSGEDPVDGVEPVVPETDPASGPASSGRDAPGDAGSDAEHGPDPEFERVPAGVGSGLATGPEHRVLDLTAVERAAERSGLG